MKRLFKTNPTTIQRLVFVFAVLSIVSILLAACGGNAPEPTTEAAPVETEQIVEQVPTEIPPTPAPIVDMDQVVDVLWVLLGYGDALNPSVVEPETVITLVFSADGSVAGSSGCNNYSSTYQVAPDGTLTFDSPFAATMMFCPRGMDQESAYLAALEKAQSLGINSEGRLQIVYDSGQPYEEQLVYAQGETSLVDTQWLLVGYGDPGAPKTVESGTAITAIFSEDGNVSGSAGCNYYAGSFETDQDQISIGPLATTGAICPTGSEQEQAYLQALGAAENIDLFGTSLRISYEGGQGVLIYTSTSLPLTGTLWALNAVDGEPIPDGIYITAIFEPGSDGEPARVAGSAGCNEYSAGYTLEQGELQIETPAATRKFCETGMDEETAYLAAIEGQHTYEILGDTLDLVTEAGTLTYIADRTPLVGALWVLIAAGDVNEPTVPVEGASFTAQFSRNPNSPSGVVAGTTGCNEYSAAYVSNLEEIKINLPEKTKNEDCAPGLFEQEQQFFLAMNAATTYQIHGSTLIMPYDEGRQALVFAATQTEVAGKRPLSDLEGTEWFLHFINNTPIMPGTLIDARFRIAEDGDSGQVSGSAGCNTYYALFGQELGMETALTSSTTCFKPDGIMTQEDNYLSSLSRSYGYWLTGDQLVINTGRGALTFRVSPPVSSQDQTHLLQNIKWYLINYNEQPSVAGNAEPFLFFNLDYTFFGNTGCNEIGGEYTTDVDQISIKNISVGEVACPDETSSKQERVTLANLEAAQFFVVADAGMQLGSDRGTLYYSSIPVERPDTGEPPVAVINGPVEAAVGEIVRFDGSNSTSEIGITNYTWDFGDGTQARGPVVENIYMAPGTYQVTLGVVDKIGQRGSVSQEISVVAQPPEQTPPTAAISGPQDGFVAEPITFSAEGSISGSSPISTFAWNFGDGTSSPASPNTTVTKLYEQPGTYLVTVVATDANKLSDSAALQVVIDTRLEGPVWSLYPVLPRSAITLQFLQGELTGFSGCNTYSATYTAAENEDGSYQVEVSNLVNSRLSCAQDLMDQEVEYLAAFGAVATARIEGNILTLVSPEMELTYYEVGTLKPEQLPE
ncbi:MAG: META domain-containing protein [Anaerolineales bacterium]